MVRELSIDIPNQYRGIGRITPSGAITEGPDGSLWFVEETLQGTVGIGRITPEGAMTEFPSPVAPDSGETRHRDGVRREPLAHRARDRSRRAVHAARVECDPHTARRVQGVGQDRADVHKGTDDHDEAEEEAESENEEVKK